VRTSATVSVVVPIRDQPELLRACADSLAATAGWDRLQLVVVDNGSSDPEIPVLRSQLEASFDLTWCRDDRPFNWSALSNLGVEASRGELVLLLNNDVEGRRPGWLAAMVEHALVDDVGAVGARLVYPDGSLQHFGVAIGLGGPAGHELLGLPPGRPSYFGLGEVAREVSAATGACLLLRRALYRSVGGCDEGIPVAFSDVDLCLRIRALGYRIICTPLAELVHHESITRGFAAEDAVGGPMFRRWQHLVRSGDPYFNPNLSRLRMEMALPDDREEDVWKDALLRLERS
jgi:GT2 family glycosyltransferase